MLSLHAASEDIRNLIKWGMILLLIFFFGFFIYRIWPIIFPPPAVGPTVKFGKVPEIPFPKPTDGIFTYTLDTVTGTLPVFSDRANVYQIELPSPNILALQQAKNQITSAGFADTPTQVSETSYEWKQLTPPYRNIVYDVLSKNFELKSDYITDIDVLSTARLGTEEKAKETAVSFLQDTGSYPEDLDLEKTKTTLLSIINNSLVPATSISSAHIIAVDLFQKKIDNLPILYPSQISLMRLLVGSTDRGQGAIEGKFVHQTISSESSTYPIKSAEQAFNDLKNGNAFIASSNTESGAITIDNVYLAYFIGETPQEYLLPIIVFEGSDNFRGYVSAVLSDWIKK